MSEATYTFCDRCNPHERPYNPGKVSLEVYLESYQQPETFQGPNGEALTREDLLKTLGKDFGVDVSRGVIPGTAKQACKTGWKSLDEGHVCSVCLAEDTVRERLDKEQEAEYHIGGTNPLVAKMNTAIATGITKDEPPEDLSKVGEVIKKPRRKRIRGNPPAAPTPEGGSNENRS